MNPKKNGGPDPVHQWISPRPGPKRMARGSIGALVAVILCASAGNAQQVHHNGFETRETAWLKGLADAGNRELGHDITDLTAHTGQSSEHIHLDVQQGNYIYYYYPVNHAPVGEELSVSVWVKANRPGIQLLGRLVLPKERSAQAFDERMTTLLRGDQYQNVGRWQRLEIRHPLKLAKEQQQLIRAELGRDVDFAEAFLDRLVLNLCAGPGATEVWIDDLEVGPVTETSPFQTTSRPAGSGENPGMPRALRRPSVVEIKQDHLVVGGKQFFMRGIRHSNAPLRVLRDAGFNTIWVDYAASPALLDEANRLGFWVVPSLPVTSHEARLASAESIKGEVTRFAALDAVLFWDLGGGLVDEQRNEVLHATDDVHNADPQRPVGADIWDGFRPYSRSLDLVGIHRWPLMTGLEFAQYREWLEQRRLLARPGSFTWTWVQTHLPDWFTDLVYGQPSSTPFQEPIGPQPEQIRLLTYTALAAGCHGLGFWSDRFLADSHQGRDRLLELALINLELQLLEPLLVSALPPHWVDTSIPEVKAAVMRTDHGTLALPMWLGKGAQFVPGQSAAAKLSMVVPEVPVGTQAWQVSPGEVRALPFERVPGGTKVTIQEFGLTTAIVFTTDNNPSGLVVRFQDQVRRMRKLAAQWSHDLAERELEKVARIETELENEGQTLPDGQKLLADCRSRIRTSVEYWNNGDFRQAYQEADRALRPLRILMRAQWEQATRGLDVPVASPYAVSFYTLPRHWRFVGQLRQLSPAANVLNDGGFESPAGQSAWSALETRLDPVDFSVRYVSDAPHEGKQCLALEIKAQNTQLPPRALERSFLAVQSGLVRLQPGTPVRISAWVRIPQPIRASVDGALIYDNAGGEPLAIRLTQGTAWKKYALYRVVPSSGTINVTLALTGLGKVYFDDVRVEPLVPRAALNIGVGS